MKLEDQVCTLEQAKRLKELGIIQKSLFYFTQLKTPLNPNFHFFGYPQESMSFDLYYGKKSDFSGNQVYCEYSAFTVAELGQMLPALIDECRLIPGKTEAECRTILLIDLLNAKILTTEEVNERLK